MTYIAQEGDKFRTVSGGDVEFWDYAGETPDGEILIRRTVEDNAEYVRHLEPTKDELERTSTDWRCLDDPTEFEAIVHMPRLTGDGGPNIGDICTRVVRGTSLMYRIRDFEQYGELRIAQLTLIPDVLGFHPYDQVSYIPGEGWQWRDGQTVMFTNGKTDELARKATRLDTLHQELLAKYLHYEALAYLAPANSVGAVVRDELAEQLFVAQTGLRREQEPIKFQEFAEVLHEEYLASIQQ
jgi:hypothetical protein